MRNKFLALIALLGAALLWSAPALAQTSPPATLPLMIGQNGGSSYSVPTPDPAVLHRPRAFLPAVVLMMTGFTRIVIVLSLMRQALGTQASPPNQVIVGLSLFLTFFVMSPTIDKVYAEAWQPYSVGQIGFDEALAKAEVPMRSFMLKQTRQADVALFSRLAKLDPAVKPEAVPFKVLVPSFVTSELKSAFQIRFPDLHSLPDHRHDRQQRADEPGHDDALARDDLAALQAHAVRAGRWLEPAAGLAGGFLCHLIRNLIRNLIKALPWMHNKSSPSASKASTCC